MFFLMMYLLALGMASIHLLLDRQTRTRERVIDIYLLHLLAIAYGAGGVIAFIGHKFRGEETAKSIGWPAGNPFQEEIAFANLGNGLLGLLCTRLRGNFWTATAVGPSVFYLGAAIIHIEEVRKQGNYAINNIGAILPDLVTPLTVLCLLFARREGFAR